MTEAEEIIKKLEQNLSSFEISPKVQNIGTVETNTDGVVRASGLSQAVMGEIVEFETGDRGVILNLDQDFVSIILFSKGEKIKEGLKTLHRKQKPLPRIIQVRQILMRINQSSKDRTADRYLKIPGF